MYLFERANNCNQVKRCRNVPFSKPLTTMDFDDLEDVEATLGPKLVELREQKRAAPRMNSLGLILDQWIRGIGWYKAQRLFSKGKLANWLFRRASMWHHGLRDAHQGQNTIEYMTQPAKKGCYQDASPQMLRLLRLVQYYSNWRMQTLTFDFRLEHLATWWATSTNPFPHISAMPHDPPAIRKSLPPRSSRWAAPIQLLKERALVATPNGRRRQMNDPGDGNCLVRCVPWVFPLHGLGIPNALGEHGDISNDSFHCRTVQKWQLRGPSTIKMFFVDLCDRCFTCMVLAPMNLWRKSRSKPFSRRLAEFRHDLILPKGLTQRALWCSCSAKAEACWDSRNWTCKNVLLVEDCMILHWSIWEAQELDMGDGFQSSWMALLGRHHQSEVGSWPKYTQGIRIGSPKQAWPIKSAGCRSEKISKKYK